LDEHVERLYLFEKQAIGYHVLIVCGQLGQGSVIGN